MHIVLGAALTAMLMPSPASAQYITVYGGPTFDQTTQTGYRFSFLPPGTGSTAGNGVAAGSATKISAYMNLGHRAFRWDASGAAATELGNLGTNSSGATESYAFDINRAGAAVGYAQKYSGGTYLGPRAVRWDASASAATELGNLGTASSGYRIGYTNSGARAINSAGTAAGYAEKYSGGTYLGFRAVRWDASGAIATELGNIGTDSNGFTRSEAYAVNSAGAAVGYAWKYSGGKYLRERAVRWDASGAATELGNLGTHSNGFTDSLAWGINSAGTAVGYADKYTGGTYVGTRAVRWDASDAAATELGNLGTNSSGVTTSYAYAINSAGAAVGYAEKHSGGTYLGQRAVRWDASGSAATELGNLGTDSSGFTHTRAYTINGAGAAVGYASKYSGGTNLGFGAVLWNLDGIAFDLNTLIDPSSGWTLTDADGISDTNWVSGLGSFDPDGPGSLSAYNRAFLLDVSSIVPEPSSAGILALIAARLLTRRRGRTFTGPLGAAEDRPREQLTELMWTANQSLSG